jgi:hypothetical protein
LGDQENVFKSFVIPVSFGGGQYQDLKLVLSDGERWCHSLVLSSMSPFLARLLLAATSPGTRLFVKSRSFFKLQNFLLFEGDI